MTPELIKQWAAKAGAFPELSNTPEKDLDFLRRFAALVAAHQRELDAQTVEELPTPLSCNPTEVQLWDVALSDCAAAIRESKP